MTYVIAGRLNKQIATELGISAEMVKIHRGRVMQRLGIKPVAKLVRLVRTASYDVRDFASGNEFIAALGSELPGCVVLDPGAPGLSCEELQVELQARGLHPPIIVVTAFDDPETRRKAQKMNAVSFFRKPVDGTALLDAVDWAMRSGSTDSNNKKMKHD